MMCSQRVELMWSIIAARVVDFPDPVAPVTSTSPRRSLAIVSTTGGRCRSRIVTIRAGITRSTMPTEPRCWKTLTRKRPRPGTEYAMSISKFSLNFCFCRALMIEKASAIVSSCIRRGCSVIAIRRPSTRITGYEPTLRCRSEAPFSAADLSRSLMCTVRPSSGVDRPHPAM